MMTALPALASSRTSVMISDFEPMSMPGGRLVEHQDVGLGREPLGDHDLLLVAARERAHGVIARGGLDREARDLLGRSVARAFAVDHEAAAG